MRWLFLSRRRGTAFQAQVIDACHIKSFHLLCESQQFFMFDIAERFGITFGNELAITLLESSGRRSLMCASSSACVPLDAVRLALSAKSCEVK